MTLTTQARVAAAHWFWMAVLRPLVEALSQKLMWMMSAVMSECWLQALRGLPFAMLRVVLNLTLETAVLVLRLLVRLGLMEMMLDFHCWWHW